MGESGELVIGGVGLARYLDPDKDAEKFAPLPSLGWDARLPQRRRRPRRRGRAAVPRARRRAGQARRAAHRAGRGRRRAARAARRARRGGGRAPHPGRQPGAGGLRGAPTDGLDPDAAALALREQLPAALVPLLAVVDDLPTRTSGKVDRDALPWPLPGGERARPRRGGPAHPDRGLAGRGLGGDPRRDGDRPEGRLLHPRRRQPHRRAAGGADPHPAPAGVGQRRLPAPDAAARSRRGWTRWARPRPCGATCAPTPRRAALAQALLMAADAGAGRPALGERRRGDLDGRRRRRSLGADRAVVVARAGLAGAVQPGRPDRRSPRAAPGCCCAACGPAATRAAARCTCGCGRPTRLAELSGATGVSGASWTTRYARALGAKIGNDVDLHSAPPVTGPAQDRARRGRRAGGRPRRLLGRRRRRAHRQDPDRRRRHGRRAQHAAARARGSARAPRSRPGPTVARRGPRRSALGGLARAAGRQGRRVLAVDPPAALALAGRSPTASRRCCSGCCPRWRRCLRSRSSRSASPARRPPRRRRARRC